MLQYRREVAQRPQWLPAQDRKYWPSQPDRRRRQGSVDTLAGSFGGLIDEIAGRIEDIIELLEPE
jgi:hypothetical protein